MIKSLSINDLSAHLFWDINKDALDFVKSKNTIIHRVLEFGVLQDWKIIKEVYGLTEIKNTSLKFRSLDPVTLSFLSHYFQLDKSDFRCYTSNPSSPSFWDL